MHDGMQYDPIQGKGHLSYTIAIEVASCLSDFLVCDRARSAVVGPVVLGFSFPL